MRFIIITASVAVLVVLGTLLPSFLSTSDREQKQYQDDLVEIFGNFDIGDTYDDVLRAYWKVDSPFLRFHPTRATDWSISSPFALGRENWRILIDFENSRVNQAVIRDDNGTRPHWAPDDKKSNKPVDPTGEAPVVHR